MAKRLVLDQLGLQLRGSTPRNVQPVRAVADALGGRGEATVTGGSVLVSAPQAAWVNGTLGHSAEYDDAHMSAWHTSSAVVPAALATGLDAAQMANAFGFAASDAGGTMEYDRSGGEVKRMPDRHHASASRPPCLPSRG
jgi:2-methylcitrate dehydratase PrpD